MAKKGSKHANKISKKNNKHYNKSFIKGAFIIVLILIVVVFIKVNIKAKNTKYDNTQIILDNLNITENLQDDIIIQNNKIYMSTEDIKKYLDSTLYIEEETKNIITTSDKKLASIKNNEESILINGSIKNEKNIAIEKDEKTYLAISDLEDVYDYKFNFIKDNNVCIIESLNKKSVKAYAKKNIKLKKENKLFSRTIEVVPKGSWVTYISDENNIAKVRTKDGNIGYAKKSKLDNFVIEREDFVENDDKAKSGTSLEYDITNKDIKSFQKRLDIINSILQQAIKNDNIYVKIIYNGDSNFELERFKIEIKPILKECGITVDI